MKTVTWANFLTMARFILIIPFLYFLFLKENNNFLNISEFNSKLIALLIFIFASLTDFFDGYLARILKEESRLGKFLDPLADKFLVVCALLAFLQLEGGLIPYWMVLTIILREFIITALRITALSQTSEVETMTLGKAKTTFQLMTIIVVLVFVVLRSYIETYYPAKFPMQNYSKPISSIAFLSAYSKDFGFFIRHTPYVLMLITTIITVFSGIRYLFKNKALYIGD